MAVTLKDIAERVGKSVPTVSRALAGFDDISPKTRLEIQRVAQAMGYEPNVTARQLQRRRTDTLGLILPPVTQLRISDPFFGEFLTGVVERAGKSGFGLNVSIDGAEKAEETYRKHIRSRRVDGFVVVRVQRRDERIETLKEYGVPFVAFGRIEGKNDFPFVDEDDAYGIRQIVDHLVSLGHTRLGCIIEPTIYSKSYHRVQGFLEGLEANNLSHDPTLIVETNFRQQSGRKSALQLLNLPEPPTAIVAVNDLLALGAMSAIQERGLVVGRDVSVTGYDNISLAETAHPTLTTVHQPAQELGRLVADILIKTIAGETVEEQQILLKPSLVIRESTGPRP
jgi:LacI family transcriptional regulator